MVDWVNKIEAANAVWMKNFAEGNAKGVGEMYTEDCKVMPTGSDVVVGREGMVFLSCTATLIYLFPLPLQELVVCLEERCPVASKVFC